jgi:hypothetical protein
MMPPKQRLMRRPGGDVKASYSRLGIAANPRQLRIANS